MTASNYRPVPIHTFPAAKLEVQIFHDRAAAGRAAGLDVAEHLSALTRERNSVRAIFACAPSQNEFLETLISSPDIDWSKITIFHMDEYVGLAEDHPQSFRSFLRRRLLDRVQPARAHLIQGDAPDPQAEAERYAALLDEAPIDLICLGIGENGHLAFNDPPVADLNDPVLVKQVELDPVCRQQQVNDGCFPTIDDVPTHALTLTLSVFKKALRLSAVVPAKTKAKAVAATIIDPVSEACPSTLLRTHPNARLYLDPDSASLLKQ